MARRMAMGQRARLAADVEDLTFGSEHGAVGGGVAGRLGWDGGVAGANDDRHTVAVGDGGVGRLTAHRLRHQIDQRHRPKRRHRAARHAGVAVVGVAQGPVDARTERGFELVSVVRSEPAVDAQPALERPREMETAHVLNVTARPVRALGRGVIGALEPVPCRRAEGLRT